MSYLDEIKLRQRIDAGCDHAVQKSSYIDKIDTSCRIDESPRHLIVNEIKVD